MLEFVESYGYLALVAVGFAEHAGAPIASVPVLVAAGGLGATAGLDPFLVLLSAAVGGLAADAGWYLLVRWRGDALVDAACGLTSHPDACVLKVEERVARFGIVYVVPAKFIPGAGNLVAAAAGLAGMRPGRFLAANAVALTLWAGAWTGLGRLFTSEVQVALAWVGRYQRAAILVAAALVVGAACWRAVRVSRHREEHRGEPPAGDPDGIARLR